MPAAASTYAIGEPPRELAGGAYRQGRLSCPGHPADSVNGHHPAGHGQPSGTATNLSLTEPSSLSPQASLATVFSHGDLALPSSRSLMVCSSPSPRTRRPGPHDNRLDRRHRCGHEHRCLAEGERQVVGPRKIPSTPSGPRGPGTP